MEVDKESYNSPPYFEAAFLFDLFSEKSETINEDSKDTQIVKDMNYINRKTPKFVNKLYSKIGAVDAIPKKIIDSKKVSESKVSLMNFGVHAALESSLRPNSSNETVNECYQAPEGRKNQRILKSVSEGILFLYKTVPSRYAESKQKEIELSQARELEDEKRKRLGRRIDIYDKDGNKVDWTRDGKRVRSGTNTKSVREKRQDQINDLRRAEYLEPKKKSLSELKSEQILKSIQNHVSTYRENIDKERREHLEWAMWWKPRPKPVTTLQNILGLADFTPLPREAIVQYPEYNHLENNDVVITIEYCHHCEEHQTSTRHNSSRYLDTAKRFAEMFINAWRNFAIRLAVPLKPPECALVAQLAREARRRKSIQKNSSNKNLERTKSLHVLPERVGAFEIQMCTKFGGETVVHILHSKLSSTVWPSAEVMVRIGNQVLRDAGAPVLDHQGLTPFIMLSDVDPKAAYVYDARNFVTVGNKRSDSDKIDIPLALVENYGAEVGSSVATTPEVVGYWNGVKSGPDPLEVRVDHSSHGAGDGSDGRGMSMTFVTEGSVADNPPREKAGSSPPLLSIDERGYGPLSGGNDRVPMEPVAVPVPQFPLTLPTTISRPTLGKKSSSFSQGGRAKKGDGGAGRGGEGRGGAVLSSPPAALLRMQSLNSKLDAALPREEITSIRTAVVPTGSSGAESRSIRDRDTAAAKTIGALTISGEKSEERNIVTATSDGAPLPVDGHGSQGQSRVASPSPTSAHPQTPPFPDGPNQTAPRSESGTVSKERRELGAEVTDNTEFGNSGRFLDLSVASKGEGPQSGEGRGEVEEGGENGDELDASAQMYSWVFEQSDSHDGEDGPPSVPGGASPCSSTLPSKVEPAPVPAPVQTDSDGFQRPPSRSSQISQKLKSGNAVSEKDSTSPNALTSASPSLPLSVGARVQLAPQHAGISSSSTASASPRSILQQSDREDDTKLQDDVSLGNFLDTDSVLGPGPGGAGYGDASRSNAHYSFSEEESDDSDTRGIESMFANFKMISQRGRF